MTAPAWSVTVPAMVPRSSCAFRTPNGSIKRSGRAASRAASDVAFFDIDKPLREARGQREGVRKPSKVAFERRYALFVLYTRFGVRPNVALTVATSQIRGNVRVLW